MIEGKEHMEDEVLLKYLQGHVSDDESRRVEDWLKVTKENQAILHQLESLWLEAGKLDPAPVAVDVDAAWSNVLGQINPQDVHARKVRVIRPYQILRIAAVLLVLFGIYQLFVIDNSQPMTIVSGFAIVKDTLADGTAIALNSNSTLEIQKQFNSKRREVVLEGEAFFEVEPDKSKPFVIQTALSEVMVLGTSFNVKAYPDSMVEVFVKSGLVKLYMIDELSGDTAFVLLRAGDKGVVHGKGAAPEKVEEKPNELFWLNRTLEFKETKLSSVLTLLEKYYNVNIEAGKDIVENSKLSSTFIDESIDTILEVIAASFELKLRKDSTNFILEKDDAPDENR